MNVWEDVKRQIEPKISAQAYQNWVSRTSFAGLDGDRLLVLVPDRQTKHWMDTEYADQICSAARAVDPRIRTIEYVCNEEVGSRIPRNSEASRDAEFEASINQLNSKFTFDNFVVGACNQFAHAAARSVATNPSRSYNPLFIYGGVGMGKTHLMHAIGRALMDDHSSMRIVFTSSERFMNDMITCIRNDRMPQFHQRYRSADVLLVDDIQLLGTKERTQEEFFHTFNELHDHQRQIVLSSDAAPKEIPGLLDRLRSRFEWGLMADIQAPDLETKMAILDKKAEADGVHLPPDVRGFLAAKLKGNVRELEGALIKLTAYSSLTSTPITLAMVQQVLRHLVHEKDRRVTIEAIQKAVGERFALKPADLRQKSNTKKIVVPRQIAMYLVKELTSASLPEIGRAFGGKHHTTVLHSIEKIERVRHTDPDLNKVVHTLLESFH